MIDLHQHSTFSDGTESVEKVIEINKAKGMEYFALTDHDTLDGTKYIIKNCVKTNGSLKYITGIEFSTEDNGKSVHLLALGYDVENKAINALVEKSRKLRKDRINERIKLLKEEFNITLSKQDLNMIKNSDNPNKPMIAQMLINMGYGTDITSTIKKYLYHKLPSSKLKSQEVIKTLHKENIICVLAHPLGGIGEPRVELEVLKERLNRFAKLGLTGAEVYYNLYNENERQILLNLAKTHNLLVSGGSDFHGKNKTAQVGELSSDNYIPKNEEITILKAIKNFYFV